MQPTPRPLLSVMPAAHREPALRAIIWEGNPDLGAILATLCELAGVDLLRVMTAEALLQATAHGQRDDVVIVDYSAASALDMERCLTIVTRTEAPAYIIHPRAEVVEAFQALARGELTWLPPDLPALTLLERLRLHKALAAARAALALSAAATACSALETLTERERDICHVAATGISTDEIAARLYISTNTVKTHVKRIRAKLALGPADDLCTASRRLLDEG